MPAFRSMPALRAGLAELGVEVWNVAWGPYDTSFVRAHCVDENVVVDLTGSQLVEPLGIKTFTTLVLDSKGNVVLRDRPDAAGYLDRLRLAVAKAKRTV